jgi:4-amino-4-deoxychorismate lyase
MSLPVLINGALVADAGHAVAVDDRGLNYGDGLFETAFLRDGAVRFLDAHLTRLQQGCMRLGIAYPGEALVADIRALASRARTAVLKIVITRGAGARGYRPVADAPVNRILSLHPAPAGNDDPLVVRWCQLRLSRNPALAGLKHLNRLEQVLAQCEWSDEAIGEALMLDTEGELVSATASNVFIVRERALHTPDLRFCGIRGVMRAQVLRVAHELGMHTIEEPLWPHDLAGASEVFVTNAVRGIRPVVALDDQRWNAGPIARQLSAALAL